MELHSDCTKQILETWDILKLNSCNFLDTEMLCFNNNVSRIHHISGFGAWLNKDHAMMNSSLQERSTCKIKSKTLDLCLEFYSLKDFSMWSACINFALSKVNIMVDSMLESLVRVYLSFIIFELRLISHCSQGDWIQIKLNPEDLGNILDFLKPLANRCRFRVVSMYSITPGSIDCVSEFISDCSVFGVILYDDVRTP